MNNFKKENTSLYNIERDVEDFFALLKSNKPSKDMFQYWHRHFSKHKYPKHTELGGKWLIFCNKEEIDEVWKKICDAQDKKILGNACKTATALSAVKYKGNHVICVYTYDSSDKEDLIRVRKGLRSIGFETPLKYKRDIETIKNIYGDENEFIITI